MLNKYLLHKVIINPEYVYGPLIKHVERLRLQIIAVTLRLLLGVLFITQSDNSRYPLVIEILGWLSLAAALLFAVMGRNNFRRIISWALSMDKAYARTGGAVAVCFGAFLVYAFL